MNPPYSDSIGKSRLVRDLCLMDARWFRDHGRAHDAKISVGAARRSHRELLEWLRRSRECAK
jgi:hypothetical protein